MRFELKVGDSRIGLDATVAADLPVTMIGVIRALVRKILALTIPPNRAALRLIWGFAELADKEGCAVLITEPTRAGYTIIVGFDDCMVYTICKSREESVSFNDF